MLQIQASSQLRGVGTTAGHPAARVQSSGIQAVVMSNTTSQGSHVGSGTQIPLKQGLCKFVIFVSHYKLLITYTSLERILFYLILLKHEHF
jgi:hypothetical protein